MQHADMLRWLAGLAKEHGAKEVISVPRIEWYGKGDDETLCLSSSGGHWLGRKEEMEKKAGNPWLVVVGAQEAPDAVLCIDEPRKSMAAALPFPGRTANRVLRPNFRVVWEPPPPPQPPPLAIQAGPLPPSPEQRIADYAQLLADAELILYAATHATTLPPSTFLRSAIDAWSGNSVFHTHRNDLVQATDARHLRLEYVLVHLRQVHIMGKRRRPLAKVSAKLREWWAAVASIPWYVSPKSLADPEPDPEQEGYCTIPQEQRDLYLLPYRRVRSLQLEQPEWIPLIADAAAVSVIGRPLDELLRKATPSLVQVIQQRFNATQMTTVGAAVNARWQSNNRSEIFRSCGQVRGQVKDLEDLADSLPPCMATLREHGQKTQHLFHGDKYYAAAFLASLGQAEATATPLPVGIPAQFGAADAIDEACRFLIGRSTQDAETRELAVMVRDIFYRKKRDDRPIWSCVGLRKKRAEEPCRISKGSVISCPYTNNGQCLSAAGLSARNQQLAYPAQFTAWAQQQKANNNPS